MKYFYNENSIDSISKNDFITGYEIKDNNLIVFYANGNTVSLEYNLSNLKKIQESMKNQILNSKTDKIIDKYKKNINSDNFWIGYNTFFTFYALLNSITTSNSFNKGLQGILCGVFVLMGVGRIIEKQINKDEINEIRKYKYFIENEDIINSEIIKRYLEGSESNSVDTSRAPVITINDIDNMSLTELKETVELIKQNTESDELSLSLNLK